MHQYGWKAFDGYTSRLRASRNLRERFALLSGYHYPRWFPILIDEKLLFEHMHILGATGGGKTSIGLQGLAIQLIRRGDGPVVLVDGKGDAGLFQTARMEAKRAGRVFKWFTNQAFRSTYAFNPWRQRYMSRLSLQEIEGLITQALNLVHGTDYARAWYGMNARILFKRSLQAANGRAAWDGIHRDGLSRGHRGFDGPIQSFSGLHNIIESLSQSQSELQAAQHLALLVESLTEYKQLNLCPALHGNHPAIDHAIYWEDVIRDNQVIYFYLVGAADLALVSLISRLVLTTLDFAAMAYKDEHGVQPKIFFMSDECQTLVARNIENLLTQVRSHGMSCVLAHQTMSQLNPEGGADLRELFMECTAVKQIFSARDPWLCRYISDMSGRVKYYNRTYQVDANDLLAGRVGPSYVAPDRDGQYRVGVQEYYGPRLTAEDIDEYSRHPNMSILGVKRAEGVTQLRGLFPVYNRWPISLTEHRRRERMPWPAEDEQTIQIGSVWPSGNGETMTPDTHPDIPHPPGIDVDETLAGISRKLKGK